MIPQTVDNCLESDILISAETDNVTFAQGLFYSPAVTNQPNTFGAKVPVFTLSQRGSPACYSSVSATKSSVEAGIFSFQEFCEVEEQEIWKPIPGYEGYEASNLGEIKSLKRQPSRILRPSATKTGYLGVNLGGKVPKKIHQLVMLAFVGPRPEGMEVCHNDGNPRNNHLGNLRYDTHSENMRDISRNRPQSTSNRQKQHIRAKAIRNEYATKEISLSKLAKKYGLHPSSISLIINGKSHSSVDGPIKGVDY